MEELRTLELWGSRTLTTPSPFLLYCVMMLTAYRECLSDHSYRFVHMYFALEAELVMALVRRRTSQNPGARWTIQQLPGLRLTNVIFIEADFYFPSCLWSYWMQHDLQQHICFKSFIIILFFLLVSRGLLLTPFLRFPVPRPFLPRTLCSRRFRFPLVDESEIDDVEHQPGQACKREADFSSIRSAVSL